MIPLKANQFNVQVESHTPTQTKIDSLGYPSQSSIPLVCFTFWEHISLTDIDHMIQCVIRCHKTLHWNEVDYLRRQFLPKHENQQLRGSNSQYSYGGNIVQEVGDMVGTLFMRHALYSPISRVIQCSYLPSVGRDTSQSSSLGTKLESLFEMSLSL